MAACPRCDANVPEGNERCRVCGYGLPGTQAEKSDPKPVVTQQEPPRGIYEDDTSVHASHRGEETGPTVAQRQIVLAGGPAFSLSAVLFAFVCALAIVLAVIALTSKNVSSTGPPTTTSTPATAAAATTTTRAQSTTTSSTTTSTTFYVAPTTRQTAPPTTTTTRPPPTTTTVHHPTTTTTSSSTTTTSPSTTTTLPPTTTTTIKKRH